MKRLFFCTLLTMMTQFFKMNAQSTIATSGGDIFSPDGTVNFTVGQPFYETYFNSNGSIAQGIQISVIEIALSNDDVFKPIETIFFPNPTKELINIKINHFQGNDYVYEILDMIGRSLSGKAKITRELTTIDIGSLQSGMYMLIVTNQINVKTTFKIIKQ